MTVIGIVMLAAGSIGVSATRLGTAEVFALLAFIPLIAAITALWLPYVSG